MVRLRPSNLVICLPTPQQRAAVALTDLLIENTSINRYVVARRNLADGTRTQVKFVDWRSISTRKLVAKVTSFKDPQKLISDHSSTAIVLPSCKLGEAQPGGLIRNRSRTCPAGLLVSAGQAK